MKNYPLLARAAATMLFVVLFSHCAKPPVILPGPQSYEITQLSGLIPSEWNDTIKVSYNTKHNPIQIAGQHISTGNPQFLFGYNTQQALRVVIGAYYDGNPYYEVAHTYLTDNKKRVTTDSIFSFGTYNRPALTLNNNGTFMGTKKYTYDSQDRVTQVKEQRFPGKPYMEVITTTYTYNAAGNAWKINTSTLNSDGTTSTDDVFPVYDTKVNPHQLHPVWQFVDLDYSRNNAFVADSYNSYGLPLQINFNMPKYQGKIFLLTPFQTLNIVYGHH